MRRLRKSLATSWRFKWLLAEAFGRLVVTSVLRVLPLPGRAQILLRAHRVLSHQHRAVPGSEEMCRAVEMAAHFVPGATCLVKAQVACAMLNRFGYDAEVRIGVLKKSASLKAHAWVKCDGVVVMGYAGNQYVELPKLAPDAATAALPGALSGNASFLLSRRTTGLNARGPSSGLATQRGAWQLDPHERAEQPDQTLDGTHS